MKPGKKLQPAPKGAGKWTRPPREAKPGPLRATLWVLLGLVVLFVGAVGGYAWAMHGELRDGLLAQEARARREASWVSWRSLPVHVRESLLAVLDTTSFRASAVRPLRREPTVTRDLVREVYGLEDGLADQAREMVLAPLLEATRSRERRLEIYVNRVPMGRAGGRPVYGVGQAAREYFGKEPERLTPSEAASLAGILLWPRLADPEEDPGRVGPRRNEVLRELRRRGVLDAEGYRAALAEPLAIQPGVAHAPMSRPVGWDAPPDTLRLTAPAEAGSPEPTPAP